MDTRADIGPTDRDVERAEPAQPLRHVKLSVIVPCLNEEEYLAGQLQALASQEWSEPWEVIVADNGSTDRSPEIVESYRGRLPNLRLLDASARRGAAHALNVGAAAAIGESLAFCDADDEVAPGWVAAMGQALATHAFVACRFETHKLNSPWAAARPNPQSTGLKKFRYPPYLPHAGAGSLGIRRELHLTIGGFDESMLACFETDYCFRVQLKHADLNFVPNAVIHLRYRDSLFALFRQGRNWARWNMLLCKRYWSPDMPPGSWKGVLRSWIELLRRARHAGRDRTSQAIWTWQCAQLVGELHGSFKYRIIPPGSDLRLSHRVTPPPAGIHRSKDPSVAQ